MSREILLIKNIKNIDKMGEYIREFETVSAYTTSRENDYSDPWVSWTEENDDTNYSKSDQQKLEIPLTFKILSDGNINWQAKSSSYVVTIEYSKNGGAWTAITSSYNGNTIPVASGDTVRFRGNSPLNDGSTWDTHNAFKNSTCKFKLRGNIMSLLDKQNFSTMTDLSSYNYAFYNLFYGCTNLIDASELILPATTLSSDLAYGNMFANCTQLINSPTLPAQTLTNRCYWHMFNGCMNLNCIKCLAVNHSANLCTDSWCAGISNRNGVFIKKLSATWATDVSGIPTGWSVVDI